MSIIISYYVMTVLLEYTDSNTSLHHNYMKICRLGSYWLQTDVCTFYTIDVMYA